MVAIEDQEPVETLRTDGPHESLRHPVRLRRAKRCTNDLAAVAAKHLVKLAREFLVPIVNQESNWFRPVRQGPRQLPRLLDAHGAVGCAVHPARCTRRLPSSRKNSTYSRASHIVSTVKRSTAKTLSMRPDELAPSHPFAGAGRTEPDGPQPRADRRRRDLHAKPLQLADNPLISPPGVLSGQTEHQASNLAPHRRATDWTRIRPTLRHQTAMPSKQGLRRDDEGSPILPR
jgi:hypothetical protein